MSNNVPIDLNNLSKPAAALIAKIETVIVERKAEINTVSSHRRVEQYWVEEEAKRQENIENITLGAIAHLTQDADPEAVADVWIAFFIEKSQIESDTALQSLWSRILASEANAPYTFSLHTLALFSELDEVEIEGFIQFCGFTCEIEDNRIVPLVFDDNGEIYNKHGINRETLMCLDEAGLIQFQSSQTFKLHVPSKRVIADYYGRRFRLVMPKATDNELDVGVAVLTEFGLSLAPICRSGPVAGFYEYLQDRWR